MKRIITIALLSVTALAANATPGGEHNNTGCNGVGNANSPCSGTPTNNGGQGGQGGKGGTANAAARADARATAIAAQAQRQSQRQAQTQQANNRLNSSISNTVSTPVTVTVSAPAASDGAKTAATEQTVKENVTAAKADPVIVEANPDRRPVSTAYAPNINPTSPCALTVSGGVQARDFGISFGGTPIADFCEKLEIARSAYNEGEADVAKEVKCGISAYRAARMRLKKPCAEDAAKAVAAEAPADRPVASLNLLP